VILRKIVAWLPMVTLYYFGHYVSVVMNALPDSVPTLAWDALYRVYNRCMIWSLELNDWAGFDLWKSEPSEPIS
jgi:hypothetical protein